MFKIYNISTTSVYDNKLSGYRNLYKINLIGVFCFSGGVCGGAITPRTVRGSSLAHRVVSLDKELYSTLSLFTQVYKWVTATYCWGVTLRWTSIPSMGGLAVLRRHTSCYGNRYKLRPFGTLARVRLYLTYPYLLFCFVSCSLDFSMYVACLYISPSISEERDTLRYT